MIVGGTPLLLGGVNRFTLFLAGDFTSIDVQSGTGGSTSRNRIAAVTYSKNLDPATVLSWNPDCNDNVRALCQYNNTISGLFLYLGGDFTTINSTSRNYLCRIDINDLTSVTLDSWNPNPNDIVRCLLHETKFDRIIVGGDFTIIDSNTRPLAAYFVDNGFSISLQDWKIPFETPYQSGAFVSKIKEDISNDRIHILGQFRMRLSYGLAEDQYLSGGYLLMENNPIDTAPQILNADLAFHKENSIFVSDDGIGYDVACHIDNTSNTIIVGDFDYATDLHALCAAKISASDIYHPVNINTVLDGFNGAVRAINATSGYTDVYYGGEFTEVDKDDLTYTRNYIAASSSNTGSISSWNPSVNNNVHCIFTKPSDNNVFFGGEFTTVDSNTRYSVACVNTNGALQNWNPRIYFNGAPGIIYCIEWQSSYNRFFLGGVYNAIVLQALWVCTDDHTDGTNTTLYSFGPDNGSGVHTRVRGRVHDLLYDYNNELLYIVGSFNYIYDDTGSVTRSNSACFDIDFSDPYDIVIQNWAPIFSNLPRGVVLYAICGSNNSFNEAYIGGDFHTVQGSTRNNACAIELDPINSTPTLRLFDPNFDRPVHAIVKNTDIHFAGEFESTNNEIRRHACAFSDSVNLTNLTDWDFGFNGPVYCIELAFSYNFYGGDYTHVRTWEYPNIVNLSESIYLGLSFQSTQWKTDWRITSIEIDPRDPYVSYIGGTFTKVWHKAGDYYVTRYGLASLKQGESGPGDWNPHTSDITNYDILIHKVHLLAAGTGTYAVRVFQIDYDQASPTEYDFEAQTDSLIHDMLIKE